MDRINVMILEQNDVKKMKIETEMMNIDFITLTSQGDSMESIRRIIDIEKVDVILAAHDFMEDGYKVCESLASEYINRAVIIIEEEINEDTMRKAMFSGAKDLLVHPLTVPKMLDSISKAYDLVRMKTEVHRDVETRVKRKTEIGQIITIFSTKGGVGKTFVSVNLAVTLARKTDKSVVLLDLDLDFGSASLALDLNPKYTITDIVDDIRNLDPDIMDTYLTRHSSGVRVLPANMEPRLNEFINGDHVQMIIKTLQNSYDFVVIDMPGRFYEPINPAFVMADRLIMVTTPEISTVRNIKASLIILNELNYPKSKIKILLNKADRGGEIKVKDIEKTLNQGIYTSIDADYKKVMSSLNQGLPYVLKNPRSSISKQFGNMAKKIEMRSEES